jgi:hypothetical protein
MYKRQGSDAQSACCPKKSLLDLKLKQRSEDKSSGAEVVEGKKR